MWVPVPVLYVPLGFTYFLPQVQPEAQTQLTIVLCTLFPKATIGQEYVLSYKGFVTYKWPRMLNGLTNFPERLVMNPLFSPAMSVNNPFISSNPFAVPRSNDKNDQYQLQLECYNTYHSWALINTGIPAIRTCKPLEIFAGPQREAHWRTWRWMKYQNKKRY